MLLDIIPSKTILSSIGIHILLLGGGMFKGAFDQPKLISLVEPNKGSFEVLFSAPSEDIKKELKKHIKKIIADDGDKAEKVEMKSEAVQQVKLEDLKSLNNLSPEMKAFLKSLQAKIQERQVYPYAAKRLRQTGQVVVRFDVSVTGIVNNVSIEKKSEHKKLDTSAFKLIAGISKVSSPPKTEMRSDKISIVVPIEYKL